MQRKIRISMVFMILVLSCCACQKKNEISTALEPVGAEQSREDGQKEEEKAQEESIFVYVCGAVSKAGVYELTAGSRVYEAVEKAGGFAENAAVNAVNQAALLKDEQQIYIPTVEEMQNQNSPNEGAGEPAESGKVNLNTASKEELMTLPGIGEAKANSIIAYREEKGGFRSTEEIKQIEGIKDGVFEKIKELITV